MKLHTCQSYFRPTPGMQILLVWDLITHRTHFQPSLLLNSNNRVIESRTLSIRRGDAAVTETSFCHNYTLAPAVLGPRDNRASRLTSTQLTRVVQVTIFEKWLIVNFYCNKCFMGWLQFAISKKNVFFLTQIGPPKRLFEMNKILSFDQLGSLSMICNLWNKYRWIAYRTSCSQSI